MNKFKKVRMNNKGALESYAKDEFNAPTNKESFRSKKQVIGELNAYVHFSIN